MKLFSFIIILTCLLSCSVKYSSTSQDEVDSGCYWKFDPQTDIRVYELAVIIARHKDMVSLIPGTERHFKWVDKKGSICN